MAEMTRRAYSYALVAAIEQSGGYTKIVIGIPKQKVHLGSNQKFTGLQSQVSSLNE